MSSNEEDIRNAEGPRNHHFNQFQIIKNVFVLCVVFFILFIAYDSLSMLQSTMNHDEGIGVACQAITYGCFCISSLMLPKYIIRKFGCKLTLVVSMCLYVPYIASNVYPHWSFMVPAAVASGLVAPLLWGSQCQYLNQLAVMYASISWEKNDLKIHIISNEKEYNNANIVQASEKVVDHKTNTNCDEGIEKFRKNRNATDVSLGPQYLHTDVYRLEKDGNTSSKDPIYDPRHSISSRSESLEKVNYSPISQKKIQATTARFFGIHGMAFLATHMCSNLMSYFILQKDATDIVMLTSNCTCGAKFCNEKSDCLLQNLQEPSQYDRDLLTGLCIGLSVLSIILAALFLDPLNDKNLDVNFSLEFLFATLRHLKRRKQILMTPLSFYIGMMQGFYVGDYTMSFVGCAWGTYHVGLVSACYGAACTVSSPSSGLLIKYIGRIPVIVTAALINIVTAALLLIWEPSAEEPILFFVGAGLWGASVGVLYSQVKAMYGFLFKNNEEVSFASYHLWYSLGFCLSFAYSNYLCTYLKIYILMVVLVIGVVGYICVEYFLRKK